MPNFKFSVLMSVYGKENPIYLDKAINSILCQTIVPDQIVLVEDGPLPADLSSVISEYYENNSSFTIVQNEQNLGLAKSLNIGLKYAKNDLVARMDSDDISVPTRFEKQLSIFKKNSDLAVVGGQVEEFNSDPSLIIGKRMVPLSEDDIVKFAKFRSPFNHPTVMFKKSVILKVGGYPNINHLEDYLLWGKIIAFGYKVENSDKTFVKMRVGDGLYSRRGGVHYLCNYLKLRKKFFELGLVTIPEMIIGDLLMFGNAVVPVQLRRRLYTSLLHRRS